VPLRGLVGRQTAGQRVQKRSASSGASEAARAHLACTFLLVTTDGIARCSSARAGRRALWDWQAWAGRGARSASSQCSNDREG
jgi:hypothetical protein